MRDIVEDLRRWWDAGVPFALATVTDVRKSAPRQPGAAMAVAEDGEVVGSVSGGCVEGAVVELGQRHKLPNAGRALLGPLAEPDGGELGERTERLGAAPTDQLHAGDERRGNRAQPDTQNTQFAGGRSDGPAARLGGSHLRSFLRGLCCGRRRTAGPP